MSQTKYLGSQFIYQWVSKQSQGNGFKHKQNSPISIISEFLDQHPISPLIVLLPPLLTHSLSLCFLSFPLFCNHPHCVSSLSLYRLSLVGFKSLLFHQFPCNSTFTQNPKKPSCLLRILLKLVPDAKQHSVTNSPKTLTTLGNRLEFNH